MIQEPAMRNRPVLISMGLVPLAGAAMAAQGLVAPDGQNVWPQWQARITVSTTALSPVSLTGLPDTTHNVRQSGALLGDFYFDAPGLRLPASLGGLRATSGLMVGARGLAQGGSPTLRTGQRFGLAVQNGTASLAGDGSGDTVPYVGVGYTGMAAKGGWGITADLGIVAENPGGAIGVGRALFGTQGLDSALRELRLSPVLQLGVRYSF
jgi:hypothetical protein